MGDRVSQSEMARRLGVTEKAVRKHVKSGIYRRGADGLIDYETAKAALAAYRDPDSALRGLAGGQAVAKEPSAGGVPVPETNLTRARTAQAAIAAQRQQLALAREKGEVIKKTDAIAAATAVVTVINERLDGLAAQLAPRVAGMTNVAEIERVARELIASMRAEVAALADAIEGVGNGTA